MMKKYVKPELFFESYELSQNIAACGWSMTESTDPKVCYGVGNPDLGNPGIVIFVEGNENCETVWEGYCYENSAGNDTLKIFQS